jgi:large subunit ribosomal protein L6
MSRIGKLPILIPEQVKVSHTGNTVSVIGPKGELSYDMSPKMGVKIEGNTINIVKKVQDEETVRLYGLVRTLIDNMVKGVSHGFKKELEINGIGYRASVSDNILTLNLGYSHPIEYLAQEGIKINVEKNVIVITGIDKQKVGQTAAEIRAYRKPEPYKGKGVKYVDETIKRKSGKTGAK